MILHDLLDHMHCIVNIHNLKYCNNEPLEFESRTLTKEKIMETDTQDNLSIIPLPKIDEMYANLRGAKMFTTLDLQSGYYHIALDNQSKAKTAFVTPFGTYEFTHTHKVHLMTLQGHLVHMALVYSQFLHFLWHKS